MKLLGYQGGLSPIACLRMIFSSTCQCTSARLPTAAAAPFAKRVERPKWLECRKGKKAGMKWRRGRWPRAACKRLPGSRDARDWAPFGGVRASRAETYNPTWPRGPVIHGPRSPRACAAAGPLFGIRLRSDAYGRGFGQGLPASVPGLRMPGFAA